ncbi:hypothetical protein BDY17DRAFT_46356 [Neohortaea acidophila]|uniref:Uncharacterized protein n=1 Tax=Neohortaea acidophila TaxID=245834 RepID=A0A6A6PG65_9PEZI|nr:uncharacterized protein BDY17DRAFT_46356 [Neohortaea acidophila]KAF2478952.1 hypothetical protein BDY17DRAFT_46356 [Neohortaea acidophila]
MAEANPSNTARPSPRKKPSSQNTNGAKEKADAAREKERKQETSKAAKKALAAQKKAKELTQAAAAAGDPDERQKLLNQALEKEVEAETFGKTAKYLNSGTWQGLCAGCGLGGSVGVWLGIVTGTLVGGVTSLVTGGLGAGIGAGVGALHGPWFKVGEWMGESIRKITGDIPGWKATEEQKGALEKMVNGVREQDRPDEEELTVMSEEGGKVKPGQGFVGKREEDEGEKGMLQGGKGALKKAVNPMSSSETRDESAASKRKAEVQATAARPDAQADPKLREQYAKLAGTATTPDPQATVAKNGARKQPRKLEIRSQQSNAT